jgi:amino acid adenylation domain-containing protein
VVFGTVLLGRMYGGAGAERALGMLINTLPVRIRLGEVGVAEGIKNTHETLAQLVRHESASLVLAQRCSGLPGDVPLFSALLNYRHSVAEPPRDAGSSKPDTARVLSTRERTSYACVLTVDDLGTDFALKMQVLPPLPAQRLCRYVQQALEQVVQALEQAPLVPARRIEVLDDAERHQMLVEWNATERAYALDRCIHELFEDQVERTPDATALVHEDRSLSYRQLNARANRLARHLRDLGVGPEVRVGICAERSLEMVVAVLATLKAGGAYVPLDPACPRERLRYLLQDSGAAVLLHAHLSSDVKLDLQQAPGAAPPMVDLCADDHGWSARSGQNLGHAVRGTSATRLAYVIYTSGSTGQPKGVMVEHRQLSNFRHAMQESLGLERGVWLAVTAYSFDISILELLCPLTLRFAVVIGDPQGGADAQESLAHLMTAHAVTHLQCTPSLLRMYMESPEFCRALSGLEMLLVGGEACPASLVERLVQHTRARTMNMYGPTETTIWSSCTALRSDSGVVSIGRPIGNTQIYLLDRHGEPVPAGAVGEICIGGAGVARGYLNRPELTAQRFMTDPFSAGPDARMYRTGDLGRYLPDGNLECLGRNDHQVKIRGHRIELEEIEATLQQQAGIREAVVLAREDEPGEQRLVAYVVSECAELEVGQLRKQLAESLPEYMLPAAYVRLAALPLTPNGKLDRRALPAPDGSSFGHRAYEAPRGELERALAQIWSDVLGVERVGRHDNFFEAGGHSLLIFPMINRLGQIGLQTSLHGVYYTPVLCELAARLQPLEPPLARHLVAIRSGDSRRPLFFMHELSGEALAYERLSRHLGDDLPVYGVQALPEDAAGPITNEALAERYVRVIRSVQPQGPYRLAGWSAGGLIAYEMARQLLADNEPVEFLGMIDSQPGAAQALAQVPDAAQWTWTTLLDLLRRLQPELAESRMTRLTSLGSLAAAVAHGQRAGWFAPSITSEEISWRAARARQLWMAFASYRPRALSVPLHLFTADTLESEDPSRGWAAIAGADLRTERIGGTHRSIMEEPHVEELARSIERALAQTG